MERPTYFARLDRELARFPAVVLYGSRQAGKTTLARELAASRGDGAIVLDLELPSDAAKLADPESFLRAHARRLVVLDEVQHAPGLFAVLRGLIDADRRPGRFLLLGSAAPALLGQAGESLVGRATYVELPPLGLLEAAPEAATDVDVALRWVRGGYPPALLAATDADSFAWREAYIQGTIDRDLPRLDVRVPSPHMRRFWLMLAHCQGQLWNASKIATSLDVSGPTARRWLDVLSEACLVRILRPRHANLKKRLVKAPKVYVRDTGLLHALLGLRDRDAVLGHPVAGGSFEGFAVEPILSLLPPSIDAGFFATHAGNEVDLVLTPPSSPPIAVEVKLSSAPKLPPGLPVAMSDLGCEHAFVVTPSSDRYPLRANVEAISLHTFLRDVIPRLG
ncbi:MAG: ATP-binding protein [Planctomycetes bacterium]|nr:ATP-binding protein [Planctomycetota bacterium]